MPEKEDVLNERMKELMNQVIHYREYADYLERRLLIYLNEIQKLNRAMARMHRRNKKLKELSRT